MITKAFALLDTKTGHYHTPFFMHHAAQAIRACIDLGGDTNTMVGRHPSDYCLVELGWFDDQAGRLESTNPHNLGTVASFLPVASAPGPLFATYPVGSQHEPSRLNGEG